jgi:hypothetical protein|uniref:Uncharacterized protein n=1 Tax=viral metagenome TaxID=1070528 RepID=A0A6C0D0Q1_9ZZZZ
MFPIGAKIQYFNDKINIKAHLQTPSFDKELDDFYHRIPLKKGPFEKTKTLSKGKKIDIVDPEQKTVKPEVKPKNKTKKVKNNP